MRQSKILCYKVALDLIDLGFFFSPSLFFWKRIWRCIIENHVVQQITGTNQRQQTVNLIDISASGVVSRENCVVETDSTTQPSLTGWSPTDHAIQRWKRNRLTNRGEEAFPVLSRLSMGGCEALLGTHRHAVSAGDGRFKTSVDEW
jgi:hypothetical protein